MPRLARMPKGPVLIEHLENGFFLVSEITGDIPLHHRGDRFGASDSWNLSQVLREWFKTDQDDEPTPVQPEPPVETDLEPDEPELDETAPYVELEGR